MSFMDAREHGSKTGGGGAASAQNEAIYRRERLRKLALETIDLAKDPYFMRNHLGSYECKLCLTLHANEGNYLAHTQGKRHQQNLVKRAARDAAEAPIIPAPAKRVVAVRKTAKIGRPGYRVTKQYDHETCQRSLLFQVDYPEIETGAKPRHRVMSAYEQKVEPWDKRYMYLLVAAEPYETIGFKVPNADLDKATQPAKFFAHWEPDRKVYTVQVMFRPAGSAPRKPLGGGQGGGQGGGLMGVGPGPGGGPPSWPALPPLPPPPPPLPPGPGMLLGARLAMPPPGYPPPGMPPPPGPPPGYP